MGWDGEKKESNCGKDGMVEVEETVEKMGWEREKKLWKEWDGGGRRNCGKDGMGEGEETVERKRWGREKKKTVERKGWGEGEERKC